MLASLFALEATGTLFENSKFLVENCWLENCLSPLLPVGARLPFFHFSRLWDWREIKVFASTGASSMVNEKSSEQSGVFILVLIIGTTIESKDIIIVYRGG